MSKYFFILISILVLVSPAQAQNSASSWKNVNEKLLERGINPSTVNWSEVTPLCAGVFAGDSQPYYQCQYDKALNSVLFTQDRAQCMTRSKADLPDRLTNEGNTETLTERDDKGEVRKFIREITPISLTELRQKRNAYVIECMQSLGWASATNWALDKRCN